MARQIRDVSEHEELTNESRCLIVRRIAIAAEEKGWIVRRIAIAGEIRVRRR